MTDLETSTDRSVEAEREAIDRLAEKIRLTSLDVAMKAARLRGGDESQHLIRNKIRELVSLSLDAVEHVGRALRSLDSEQLGSPDEAERNFTELKRMESNIVERTEELLKLLGGADADALP